MFRGFVMACGLVVLSGCSQAVYHQPDYYHTTLQPELQPGQIYAVDAQRPKAIRPKPAGAKSKELKNNPGKFALQYPKPSYFE